MGKKKVVVVQKILMPSEKFRALIDILRTSCRLCGCDVLAKNFKFNFLTYASIVASTVYIILTIYTVTDVFLKREYGKVLQVLCYSGAAFQAMSKMVAALSNGQKFRSVHLDITHIIDKYEQKSGRYADYMHKTLTTSKKVILGLLIIYSMTVIVAIVVPVTFSITNNDPIMLMEFLVPGLDKNKKIDNVALIVVHSTCIFLGMFGNFASDAFLFIIVGMIPLLKNILLCKFDELDEVIRMHPRDTKKTFPKLKDIFDWHQTYIDLSERIKMLYFWVIFIQMATGFYSIVFSLVCMVMYTFHGGPTYIIFCFIMIYSYCALGNFVNMANDDVTEIIYNCLWYELTVPEQKMLLSMLRQSQHATGMSIGGMEHLTLNTGLKLTKTIYSITMMLMECVD